MAAYISVPRDLTRVKSKLIFHLTKRQLLCFGVGALIGVPVFFLLKRTGNVSIAALGMMVVMLPLFSSACMSGTDSRWKWWQSTLSRQNSFVPECGLSRRIITMQP